MPKRTGDYRAWLLRELSDPIVAKNYVNAIIEDSPHLLLTALRNVAEARRMAKVAERAGVNRESLYRTLSEEGNPTLETLNSVLAALDFRIKVETVEANSATNTGTTATAANQEEESITAITQTVGTTYLGSGTSWASGGYVTCIAGPLRSIPEWTSVPTELLIQAEKSEELVTIGE